MKQAVGFARSDCRALPLPPKSVDVAPGTWSAYWWLVGNRGVYDNGIIQGLYSLVHLTTSLWYRSQCGS